MSGQCRLSTSACAKRGSGRRATPSPVGPSPSFARAAITRIPNAAPIRATAGRCGRVRRCRASAGELDQRPLGVRELAARSPAAGARRLARERPTCRHSSSRSANVSCATEAVPYAGTLQDHGRPAAARDVDHVVAGGEHADVAQGREGASSARPSRVLLVSTIAPLPRALSDLVGRGPPVDLASAPAARAPPSSDHRDSPCGHRGRRSSWPRSLHPWRNPSLARASKYS